LAGAKRYFMIRDARIVLGLRTLVALYFLFLFVYYIRNPNQSVFPAWFWMGLAAVGFGACTYEIVRTLMGPPLQTAAWARKMSDRQLWTIKGVLIAAIAAYAIVVFSLALHHS